MEPMLFHTNTATLFVSNTMQVQINQTFLINETFHSQPFMPFVVYETSVSPPLFPFTHFQPLCQAILLTFWDGACALPC